MRNVICLAAMLAALIVCAQDAPARLELSLRLSNALFVAPPQPAAGAVLLLETERVVDPTAPGGVRWERVWGMGRDFTSTNCLGRVASGEVSETRIRLTIEMLVGDPLSPGGRARYQLDLAKGPAGADGAIPLTGTYQGTYRGAAIRGAADGAIKPPRPARDAAAVPVTPGEHPRILFRKADLPRLKALAGTAFGKAAIAAMRGPVGDGIKYQLTGDATLAANAYAQCEAFMAMGWDNRPGSGWSSRLEQVAIAYDLCYDAWSPANKLRVEKYLIWASDGILAEQVNLGRTLWHAGQPSCAALFAGAGFAGLALWGEPGPAPGKPISPSEADRIAPAVGYVPADGVPVLPLEPGVSPRAWLALPPLEFAVDGDPLLEIGGVERARPEPGMKLTWGPTTAAFAPLDKQYLMDDGGIFMSTLQTNAEATMAFYCVLKSDGERTVRIVNPQTPTGRPLLVLNGNVLHDGRVVEISEGLYPLLVIGRFTGRWSALRPMLVDASMEDIEHARDELARRQGEYRQAYRDWEDDQAEWERHGGANVRYLKLLAQARMLCYRYAREAADTDELQSEKDSYRSAAFDAQGAFAAAYRTMFGEDLSPYPDVSCVVPRRMFAHDFPAGPLPVDNRGNLKLADAAQDISGDAAIPTGALIRAFPGIADAYKPAALWLWNRRLGVEGTITAEKPPRSMFSVDAVRTFVQYPFGMAPKHPRDVMPLTWQGSVFGYHGFRSGWTGAGDIIVQTYGKSHVPGGWNAPNAGTFRIFGYGKVWATGPGGLERWRFQENVVQFPDDPTNSNGRATVRYAKSEPDGSGVVTYDMRELYQGRKVNFLGRDIERPYDRYGNGHRPSAFVDLGITGSRAFGVDFSGKSGAPCLFVLVDDITGGKQRLWTWQQVPGMAATKDGFTITQDGAVLKGTFVTPLASLALTQRPTTVQSTLSMYEKPRFTNDALYAQGEKFFVVCTLGKGAPPEMTVDGTGLQAVVTIGQRTVRYDGEKIVFGDAP